MRTILKTAREQKNIKTRELAQLLGIDQALVSKFENGSRKPTREQISKLATALDINFEELMIAWLKEKILYEIGTDDLALKAMLLAEEEIKYNISYVRKSLSKNLQVLLNEIDELKSKLDNFRQFDSYRIKQALELEYTFESNRIEGNTLTLRETDLVINEGLTIVPLRLFTNEKGLAKLEIALCRGKKNYDKRESLKEQDTKRELDRIKKAF